MWWNGGKGHLKLVTSINADIANLNPDSACTCIFLGPAYRFANSCNIRRHHQRVLLYGLGVAPHFKLATALLDVLVITDIVFKKVSGFRL